MKCKKCGAICYTKCPTERSVFLENGEVAQLRNLLVQSNKPYERSQSLAFGIFEVLTCPPSSSEKDVQKLTPDEQIRFQALMNLQQLERQDIIELVCDHHWTGRCEFDHNHR